MASSAGPATRLATQLARRWNLGARSLASTSSPVNLDHLEHATGLQKLEIDAKKKGVDMFEEAWLSAPAGTAEEPVVVTSSFSERIVGVTDPEDDGIVVWGVVKEGEAPKQIVDGGEFFVLKKMD